MLADAASAATLKQLRRLEAENAELRELVRQFQATAAPVPAVPACLRLSPKETALLGTLIAREGLVTYDRLMLVLYATAYYEAPGPQILHVFMSRIRRHLRPYDITIETHWNRGWSLPAASRARLAELRAIEP